MSGTWKRRTATDWEDSVGVLNHTHDEYVSDVDHTKATHDALDIDADTVDGQHASAFASSGHTHPSDAIDMNLLLGGM